MRNYSIGIVTFTYGTNFGCMLQRYALQTVLMRFNVNVKSLMYRPSSVRNISRFLHRLFSSEGLSLILNRSVVMLKQIFDKIFEERQKVRRINLFRKFDARFLLNTKRLNSYDEVKQQGKHFDLLVAGSDQVWNSTWYPNEEFFKFYMLDFVPSQKKISYAASLGLSKLPEDVVPKFQRYLSDFSWISVRENEGAIELKRILDRPVDVVLDPTMLLSLEEWDVIANQYDTDKLQKSPYILCYALGNQESVVQKARQIQQYHKLPILYLCTTVREKMTLKIRRPYVIPIMDAGPGEFVSLFKNSTYVVTDSFHGTVFSILYHRPFFTMMRDKKDPTKSMNSRMSTLFSTFHLESCLFSPDDKSPLTPESFEINYEAVDKILQERREYSINKLREAIENVVKRNVET